MGFDHYGDDDSGIIFRDVVTLALVGIVALVVILLAHINPPGENANADITPPGNVIIELTWGHDLDADVDLWVQAPGDVPVGYSNKGGEVFNLLRDDLGHANDPSDVNLETAFSRGIKPGEYIVNVHLYRKKRIPLPLAVKVVARVKTATGSVTRNLVSREVKLKTQGEEVTAFRFRLTEKGELVRDSVNMVPRPLRSA